MKSTNLFYYLNEISLNIIPSYCLYIIGIILWIAGGLESYKNILSSICKYLDKSIIWLLTLKIIKLIFKIKLKPSHIFFAESKYPL